MKTGEKNTGCLSFVFNWGFMPANMRSLYYTICAGCVYNASIYLDPIEDEIRLKYHVEKYPHCPGKERRQKYSST